MGDHRRKQVVETLVYGRGVRFRRDYRRGEDKVPKERGRALGSWGPLRIESVGFGDGPNPGRSDTI